MKDKRLDALLKTLLPIPDCAYYDKPHIVCYMGKINIEGTVAFPSTNCQGDIRKCEREE